MANSTDPTAIVLANAIGEGAVREYVEKGRALPDVLDLEIALASLPVLTAWLRRAMDFKGRAEMIVKDHLAAIESRQRVYGSTVFGLKDGTWQMEEWEARLLREYLQTYVGADFTQAALDKAIRIEPVLWTCAACKQEQAIVCSREACGTVVERLVVDHRGINAIEKVARREVKEKIALYRRRGNPSLDLKGA